MHVLGLPPAFVLSQDQTLRLKSSSSGFGLKESTSRSWRMAPSHSMPIHEANPKNAHLVMAKTLDTRVSYNSQPTRVGQERVIAPPPAFLFLPINLSKSNCVVSKILLTFRLTERSAGDNTKPSRFFLLSSVLFKDFSIDASRPCLVRRFAVINNNDLACQRLFQKNFTSPLEFAPTC